MTNNIVGRKILIALGIHNNVRERSKYYRIVRWVRELNIVIAIAKAGSPTTIPIESNVGFPDIFFKYICSMS